MLLKKSLGIPNISVDVTLRWIGIAILIALLIYSSVLGQNNKQKCHSYTLTETDLDGIESYLIDSGFYHNDSTVTVNSLKNLGSLNLKDMIRLQNLRNTDSSCSDITQLSIDFDLAPDSSSPKNGVGRLCQNEDTGFHNWYWNVN